MKEVLQVVAVGGRGRSADYSAVVPDIFTEHGVSGEEYAHLERHIKSVNVGPPERWSAEKKKTSQQL